MDKDKKLVEACWWEGLAIPEWPSGFPYFLQVVWILQEGVHDLSHSQLQVLFYHLQLQRISIWFQYDHLVMSLCRVRLLCCWKRVFAKTSAVSWQHSVSLCPASLCTPRPNLRLLQVSLNFLVLHSSSLFDIFFGDSSRKSCRSS